MKSVLWRLVGLTLLLVLISVPVNAAAKTTLTLYFQWEPALDTLKQAVAIYEQRNPNIKVDIVTACIDCSTNSGYEKLLTAIAAGAGPDLVTLNGSYYVNMVNMGTLEPLTKYLAGTDWQSKYQPVLWNGKVINGQMYSLPAFEGGPTLGLIYNKDIFAESGVPNPGENSVMAWDEFGALTKKLAKRNADGRWERLGFYPKEAAMNGLGGTSNAYCTDWLTDDGMVQLDNPRLVEAMENYKTYFYDPFGFDSVMEVVRGKMMWTNHATSLFATKGTATIATGYWSAGELKWTMPDGNLGVTWVPNKERLRSEGVSAWGLSMLSSSKHKDEAWKLMQFLASPETTRLFFEQQGWMGGLHKDLARYIDLRTNPASAWYIMSLERADRLPVGKPTAYGNLAGQQWEAVYDKVVSGQGDARTLLTEATRLVNAKILEDMQKNKK